MLIFFSYSRVNEDQCDQLMQHLPQYKKWTDKMLVPQDEWWPQIERMIDNCAVFINLVSPHSLRSKYCQEELRLAREKNKAILNVLIAPVPPEEMPPEIGERQYIDMSAGLTTRSLAYLNNALHHLEREYSANGIAGTLLRQPAPQPARPTNTIAVLLEVMQAYNEHRYDDAQRELDKLSNLSPEEDNFIYQRYVSIRAKVQRGLQQTQQRVQQQLVKDKYQLIVMYLKNEDTETRKEGIALFREFYKQHPDYDYLDIAGRLRLRPPTAPVEAPAPRRATIKTPLAQLDFRLIPAGDAVVKLGQKSTTGKFTTAAVPAFYMAQYPLTNQQAKTWRTDPKGFANPDWWSFSPFAQEWRNLNSKPMIVQAAPNGPLLPFTNISWYEAMALCRYLSSILGFTVQLPTRAQRIRAARGDEARAFAWLGEFTPNHANTKEGGIGDLTDVTVYDELGKSAFSGISDLCGNCWEWCRDDDDQQVDITTNHHRVMHGGAFHSPTDRAHIDFYYAMSPSNLDKSIGLRLVIEE